MRQQPRIARTHSEDGRILLSLAPLGSLIERTETGILPMRQNQQPAIPIDRLLAHADDLRRLGYEMAAGVYARAAMEGSLVDVCHKLHCAPRTVAFGARHRVGQLEGCGFIPARDATLLRDAISMGNRAAHNDALCATDLEFLLSVATVFCDWAGAADLDDAA